MTLYQLIEDLARKLMEWAQRRQNIHKDIVSEIDDKFVNHVRTERMKRILL